jgi:hypothetical protein
MAQAPTVAVVGLRALTRDVNKLCENAGELNKELSQAGRTAAEPVAQATTSELPIVSGRLASSVRVSATRSGAAVRMGRASVPWAGPVEFGGWPHGREYLADGRYLFPAAKSLAEQSAQLYSEAAQRALDSFNWTNETTNAEAVHD